MVTTRMIEPSSGRLETMLVSGLTAMVALGGIAYALTQDMTTGPQRLMQWQVSAFDGLSEHDQAIYSALSVAAQDITYWNYDLNEWPTPEDLEAIFLPPFAKDMFWQQHGEVEWRLHAAASKDHGGTTVYSGSGGKASAQSAYLLVFLHRHVGTGFADQPEIWVHEDTMASKPDSFKPEALIKAGWRKVVPHTGADERARLKG